MRRQLLHTTALSGPAGIAIVLALWRPYPPYSLIPEIQVARWRAAAGGTMTQAETDEAIGNAFVAASRSL